MKTKKHMEIDWRLFRKAVDQRLNASDQNVFNAWLADANENQNYFVKAKAFYEKQKRVGTPEPIDHLLAFNAFVKQTKVKSHSRMRQLQVAVSIALLLTTSIIGYFVLNTVPNFQSLANSTPIKAKTGQVELLLSTGEKVLMKKEGERLIKESQADIKKEESTIDYLAFNQQKKKHKGFNTIKVPRGTDFKVILSDSTVVWLNAESSITYPVQFTSNVRKVKITGEAYFDVAHNKEKPFIVETGNTKIQVLGTVFNVKAYESQNEIFTTLVEGKVLVDNGLGDHVVIKPNEQAISGRSPKLRVKAVDVNQVIAWRLGMFDFEDEKLSDILDELSRWYDLKIFYESADLKEVQFTGGLERYEDLNQLLELFELTKSVKFLVKKDAILVKKYK